MMHGIPRERRRCHAWRTVNLLAVLLAVGAFSTAKADQASAPSRAAVSSPAPDDVRMVAPALEKYTREQLLEGLWRRPGLSPRDRSIITVSALIARNQTIDMPFYFNLALDNGVKPRELSEIITHLAFYSGWPNAMSAVVVAKDIFAQRGIGSDQLPARSPELLPLNPSAEGQRAASVDQQLGPGFPGLVQCFGIFGCGPTLRPGIGAW
jgi:4-carboxymuconolactone decarboxylase